MKFVINENEYSAMDELSFNPETDLTGDSVPISEFEARLFTNDEIKFGQWAELRDDLDNLWARYWLSYAERVGHDVDKGTYIVRIIGQSPVTFLERITLAPIFYDGTPASDILAQTITDVRQYGFPDGTIIPDEDLLGAHGDDPITGFFPEQTARERLQWLMLVVGGYVSAYASPVLEIKPLSETRKTIPLSSTFWKPTITHRDYITYIYVAYYTFEQREPESHEEYVTDGTRTWVLTTHGITLRNSNAPTDAPENGVEIKDITICDSASASRIVQNYAKYYFDRTEIELDAINNGEFWPGDKVLCYTDEDQMFEGYINRCDFQFGVQARSTFSISGAKDVVGKRITLLYRYGNMQLAREEYFLPVGEEFSISTHYLDWSFNGHRYIFMPNIDAVTGTLTNDSVSDYTIVCSIALDQYTEPASGRETIEALYTDALAHLQQYYDTQMMGATSEKKIMQLENSRNEDMARLRMDYSRRMDDEGTTQNVLHIVAADSVELDVGVIDEDERTVEIG